MLYIIAKSFASVSCILKKFQSLILKNPTKMHTFLLIVPLVNLEYDELFLVYNCYNIHPENGTTRNFYFRIHDISLMHGFVYMCLWYMHLHAETRAGHWVSLPLCLIQALRHACLTELQVTVFTRLCDQWAVWVFPSLSSNNEVTRNLAACFSN